VNTLIVKGTGSPCLKLGKFGIGISKSNTFLMLVVGVEIVYLGSTLLSEAKNVQAVRLG
jgi:hypothetical protein